MLANLTDSVSNLLLLKFFTANQCYTNILSYSDNSKNTHHMGEFYCTASLKINYIEYDQTRKSVIWMNWNYRIQIIQMRDRLHSDTSPLKWALFWKLIKMWRYFTDPWVRYGKKCCSNCPEMRLSNGSPHHLQQLVFYFFLISWRQDFLLIPSFEPKLYGLF